MDIYLKIKIMNKIKHILLLLIMMFSTMILKGQGSATYNKRKLNGGRAWFKVLQQVKFVEPR